MQNDAQLVAAIRSDDMNRRDSALKQLLLDSVVNGKLRDLIKFYNLNHVEADDILQEAVIWLDDLVRTGKFRGDSAVRTFLISICKNLLRADLKKVKRVVLTDDFKGIDEADESMEGFWIEEKTALELQRDDVLRQLMSQVTLGCQEVLTLYYFKAFSMAQVAAERGLAGAHQAKKAADRCRGQLRDLIAANPALGHFLKENR